MPRTGVDWLRERLVFTSLATPPFVLADQQSSHHDLLRLAQDQTLLLMLPSLTIAISSSSLTISHHLHHRQRSQSPAARYLHPASQRCAAEDDCDCDREPGAIASPIAKHSAPPPPSSIARSADSLHLRDCLVVFLADRVATKTAKSRAV